MTTDDRVRGLVGFGFTTRQAGFLARVLRHAGVCVPRQYAAFAGIAEGGAKCHALFAKLVQRRFAVAADCVHNRARVYHVHHTALFRAIGEPQSRYRRPVPAMRITARLMELDAVLATPSVEWCTTAAEQRAFLAGTLAAQPTPMLVAPTFLPSSPHPDRRARLVPIGRDQAGRVVLLFVATELDIDAFRSVLRAYAPALRRASDWTLRLVLPRPVDRAYDVYQQVVREEWETPLHADTIAELTRWFEHRRATGDRWSGPPSTDGMAGVQPLVNPRFDRLYRAWVKHGDVAFCEVSSSVLAEALDSRRGRVECHVLPHTYRHLSPLVNDARPRSVGVEKGERRGAHWSVRPQPPVVDTADEADDSPLVCSPS